MNDPRNQSQYQVRLDWGVDGAAAVAPGAHVVVWADALPSEGAPDPLQLEHDGAIVAGSVGSRAAVAQWILDRQVELGDRAIVAVVAAGGEGGRFAVEDLLAAGAIIDALADVGIDYTSPEAAAAAGAYASLRNAASHLLSASVSGQQLVAAEGREALQLAQQANSQPEVRVLRELRQRT